VNVRPIELDGAEQPDDCRATAHPGAIAPAIIWTFFNRTLGCSE
jgi:hypothetical protein